MGGPAEGKYYIQPVGAPGLRIGVDGVGNPWVPVVFDGANNVFTVKKLDNGTYLVTLDDGGIPLYVKVEGVDLVASVIPPPIPWTIEGPDGGPYTVREASPLPPGLWSQQSNEPKTPVTVIIPVLPPPFQLWNFQQA